MPAWSDSKRYSPASFVLVVWTAPVALLVIVTSALFPITAWVLSTIVPCRLALAVTCPSKLLLLKSAKQHRMARNHRLLFIFLSPEIGGFGGTISQNALGSDLT